MRELLVQHTVFNLAGLPTIAHMLDNASKAMLPGLAAVHIRKLDLTIRLPLRVFNAMCSLDGEDHAWRGNNRWLECHEAKHCHFQEADLWFRMCSASTMVQTFQATTLA